MSMPLADLIFLAFALSVDAFVVAFSYGLLIKKKRLSNGIKLSLSTGAGSPKGFRAADGRTSRP